MLKIVKFTKQLGFYVFWGIHLVSKKKYSASVTLEGYQIKQAKEIIEGRTLAKLQYFSKKSNLQQNRPKQTVERFVGRKIYNGRSLCGLNYTFFMTLTDKPTVHKTKKVTKLAIEAIKIPVNYLHTLIYLPYFICNQNITYI